MAKARLPFGGSSFLWSPHSDAGFPLCRLETRVGRKPAGWMCSGVTHYNTSVNPSADSATHSEDTATSGLMNHVHPSAPFLWWGSLSRKPDYHQKGLGPRAREALGVGAHLSGLSTCSLGCLSHRLSFVPTLWPTHALWLTH